MGGGYGGQATLEGAVRYTGAEIILGLSEEKILGKAGERHRLQH